MVYVCLALVAVLAATVVAFTGLLRSQSRAHARREELILNKLLHAVGTPWQPAPADLRPTSNGDAELASAHERWTTNPEQEP